MEQKPKRKPHTSSAVKNRWNAAHYDKVVFSCKKGGKDLIKRLAEQNGQSMAKYITDLIRADALRRSQQDVVDFFTAPPPPDTLKTS